MKNMKSSNRQERIIVFFGPPGSGKGTQADMLGETLGVPVISPGELLRHERDEGSAIGKVVEEKISKGILVSDEIVETILDKRFNEKDVQDGFILDGYPRRKEQLGFFEKKLFGIMNDKEVVLAIYIDVDDAEIEHRISGRRVCDCGASYHVTNNPPKEAGVCDLCGEKLYQRKDDSPAILRDRLSGFHKRIKPLLDFFAKNYRLVRVDGAKKIDDIKKDIIELLDK